MSGRSQRKKRRDEINVNEENDEERREENTEERMENYSGRNHRAESCNDAKMNPILFPIPLAIPHELFSVNPYLSSDELMNEDELLGHFDGACQGNGKQLAKEVISGFGFCFVDPEDGRWLSAVGGKLKTVKWTHEGNQRQLQITTNNRAEIVAEIELINALTQLKNKGAKFQRCHIVGDSEYAILDKVHVDARNLPLIRFRDHILDHLKTLVDVAMHRVDRQWNTNADECANAGITGKPFEFVRPTPLFKIPTMERVDILQLLRVASSTRERTWRTLPEQERQQFWNATALLMRDAESAGLPSDVICLLAPRILLRTSTKSHRKLNHIKRNLLAAQLSKLSRLSIVNAFLTQQDFEIVGVYPDRQSKKLNCSSDIIAQRIHGYLAQRCPGKALKSADGGKTLPNSKEVLMQWKLAYAPNEVPSDLRHPLSPTDNSLPSPLPQSSCISVSTSMLSEAIRHSRNGAANGMTGWTKELAPTGHYALSVQSGLVSLTSAIINNSMDENLGDFMRMAAGVCFEQGPKKRTCGLRDYVMKTAWRIALLHTPVSPYYGTAQMMGIPNGPVKAARKIQSSLDAGRVVVIGDAINAHPWFSRRRAKMWLEKTPQLAPLYAIFNFTYCHATKLKAFDESGREVFCLKLLIGMIQGCTSAMKMFNGVQHDCAITAIPDYENYTTFIADDSATEGETEEEAVSRFNKLADALEAGDIKIRGPKTKILSATSEIRWHVYAGALVMIKNSKLPLPTHKDLKPLLRLKKRIDLIMGTDLSHQDTLLLAIHTNKSIKYFLQATNPEITAQYGEWIHEQLMRPFLKACGYANGNTLPKHAQVQLYASTDMAGIGMFDPREPLSIYDALGDLPDHWDRMNKKFHLNCERNNVFKKSSELVQYNKPWFSIYPTSPHCVLSNHAVAYALTLLLDLSNDAAECADWSKSITPPETKYCDHLTLCRTCGANWWKYRHDRTLYSLFNTATKFCIALQHDAASLIGLTKPTIEIDENENNRDETERGKGLLPDGFAMMVIEGDKHLAAKLNFIDLTICHWASSKTDVHYCHPIVAAYNHKVSKYKNFLDWSERAKRQQEWDDEENQTSEPHLPTTIRFSDDYVTRPIVLTATGYASKSAMKFLHQLASQAERSGFAQMALARMQVALLNAQAAGVYSSVNRSRMSMDAWKQTAHYREWKTHMEEEQKKEQRKSREGEE